MKMLPSWRYLTIAVIMAIIGAAIPVQVIVHPNPALLGAAVAAAAAADAHR